MLMLAIDHLGNLNRWEQQIPLLLLNTIPILTAATSSAALRILAQEPTSFHIKLFKHVMVFLAIIWWILFCLGTLMETKRGLTALVQGRTETDHHYLLRWIMPGRQINLNKKFFIVFGLLFLLDMSLCFVAWSFKVYLKTSFTAEVVVFLLLLFAGLALESILDMFTESLVGLLINLPVADKFPNQALYFGKFVFYSSIQMHVFHLLELMYEEYAALLILTESILMMFEGFLLLSFHLYLFSANKYLKWNAMPIHVRRRLHN